MRHFLSIISIIAVAGAVFACTGSIRNSGETYPGGWQQEYLGNDQTVPFFPDENANYWSFHFSRDRSSTIALKITGRVPDARYYSFNVYDDDDFSPVGSISNEAIASEKGQYELFIGPANKLDTGQNKLTFDPSITKVSVFVRIYLPEGSAAGGVPLPLISAFDTATGLATELPKPRGFRQTGNASEDSLRRRIVLRFVERRIDPVLSLNSTGTLDSFRIDSGGLYPNFDNNYLSMPVTRTGDEIAVVRFRPPSFGISGEDVRYWSLSFGDQHSYNLWTVHDEMMTKAGDGFVYTVISDQDLPQPVSEPYYRDSWRGLDRALIIYRNLLTRSDYEYAMTKVPLFDDAKPSNDQWANLTIGDYAPHGVLVTPEQIASASSLASFF